MSCGVSGAVPRILPAKAKAHARSLACMMSTHKCHRCRRLGLLWSDIISDADNTLISCVHIRCTQFHKLKLAPDRQTDRQIRTIKKARHSPCAQSLIASPFGLAINRDRGASSGARSLIEVIQFIDLNQVAKHYTTAAVTERGVRCCQCLNITEVYSCNAISLCL